MNIRLLKMKELWLPGLMCLALAVACKPDGEDAARQCTYTMQPDSASVQWTAFKFSQKVGVTGKFKNIAITPAKTTGSLAELLTGLQFQIDASSVDSGAPDRDKKIAEHFFGTMQDPGIIAGQIESIDDGQARLLLKMNGQEQELTLNYSLTEQGSIVANGDVDVKHFGAVSSLTALNKVCEALHKGQDQKSVLWPDVNLEIKAGLQSDCQ